MSEKICCLPHDLCENVECSVEETSDGLDFHLRGKSPDQTEAIKTFYSSWKTLRGNKEGSSCCCC